MAGEIAAIILAAGESTRMGRAKALLPWGRVALVEWQVAQLRAAGAEDVVVVLGARADEVRPSAEASGARVVLNEAYREGRASSLRAGALALREGPRAILVLSVDQPRPSWVSARLLDEWRRTSAAIASPRHQGKGGHPILVAGALLPELCAVDEATLGLRAVIERHKSDTHVVEFQNSCAIVDLNTPIEYESALAAFSRGDWDADLAAV